jgi:serine O-acetyltransferase
MTYQKGLFRNDLEKYYTILYRNSKPGFSKKIRLWLFDFGLHCVAVYRLGELAHRLKKTSVLIALPLWAPHKILDYIARFVHHVNIDAKNIGPGFYIGHVGNIFIGPVNIGSNCSVTHNVTIGVGHAKFKEGIPVIGDDVWIGAGSIISGAITIGNSVTINSGSILTKSIPDRCLVAGNPARVIGNDYDNSEILVWRFDKNKC